MTDYEFRMVMEERCRKQLKKHEGYKATVYLDTKGVPTGGYGHAFLHGSSLPKELWEQIFLFDFSNAKQDADTLISQRNLELSEIRRLVLVELMFNMGMTKLLKFKNFLFALSRKDYAAAAYELKNSKWYSDVGSGRADTLIKQMKDDTYA